MGRRWAIAVCASTATLTSLPATAEGIISQKTDTTIQVISDSLGVPPWATVYKLATDIAESNPAVTVDYHLWDIAKRAYDGPLRLQTGKNGPMVRIYNFAVGATQPTRPFGRDRSTAIDAVDADFVVWQHGKNISSEQSPGGKFQSAWEMYRLIHPRAVNIVILEPPNRDDDKMENVNREIVELAGAYGDVKIVDAYTPWLTAGKPTAYYNDNLHPNAAGVDALSRPALSGALVKGRFAMAAQRQAMLTEKVDSSENTLSNGIFSTWGSSIPADWKAAQALSWKSDVACGERGVLATGSNGADLRQIFSADQLRRIAGQPVTIAIHKLVPNGSSATSGITQFRYTDETGFHSLSAWQTPDREGPQPTGQCVWEIIHTKGIVGSKVSSAMIRLIPDNGKAATSVLYIRAILSAGKRPKDVR